MEREFIYVCIVRFLTSLSWAMINILLVIYATTFDAPALLGSLWSVIGISRFLSENPGGMLVDKVGNRPVIIGGIATIMTSYVIYMFAQTSTHVLISSSLAGMGFAVSTIGLMTQAADYALPSERARYMGVFQGSTIASNIVGPTIGGFLADYSGLRAPFVASNLTVSLAVLIAIIKIRDPEKKIRIRSKEGVLRSYTVFMKNRLYLTLFLVSFLFSLIGWCFQSMVLPTYGRRLLLLTIAQIGLLSSITSTVIFFEQLFLSGFMERHFSRRILVTIGFLTCSVAIYFFSVVSELHGLVTTSLVLGIGMGIITPSLEAIWVDITKSEERGRVYGIRTAFFDFGQISWAIVITSLTNINLRFPLYAIALAALLSGVLLFMKL